MSGLGAVPQQKWLLQVIPSSQCGRVKIDCSLFSIKKSDMRSSKRETETQLIHILAFPQPELTCKVVIINPGIIGSYGGDGRMLCHGRGKRTRARA